MSMSKGSVHRERMDNDVVGGNGGSDELLCKGGCIGSFSSDFTQSFQIRLLMSNWRDLHA